MAEENFVVKKIVCEKLCEKDTYVCVSEGKKCSFSENLACFAFLLPPF